MPKLIFRFSFLAAFLVPLFAFGQSGYNEVFDSNGKLRPAYEAVYPLWSAKYSTPRHENEYLKWSREQFTGDNALDPMPRMILRADYDELKKGVEQRALAIREFLKDHYSGNKAYAKAGIIPEAVVNRIISRNGEAGYQGQVPAGEIAFMYGPDIIRDGNGTWRVIEDNPGYIGGIGDLKLAQNLTLQTFPELKAKLKVNPADEFYIKLAANLKKLASQRGGIPILYSIPSYSSDNEDRRVAKLLSDLGITTVTPFSKKHLQIRKDGVYLVSDADVKGQKIGYMFLNDEHAWVDPKFPAANARNLMEAASAVLADQQFSASKREQIRSALLDVDVKTGLPNLAALEELVGRRAARGMIVSVAQRNSGLIKAILEQRVGANYTPGIDFIGDKEFYVYVENLIRFYLKQEPLLHNIPTKKFSLAENSAKVDEALLASVFENLSKYVIKKVDGRGGNAVWVGPKLKSGDTAGLEDAIRSSPDFYIVQDYTPLSEVNDKIVDLRVITSVTPLGAQVTDTPWGRGLPKSGNGKVNVSDKGREVTVLIVDQVSSARPKLCSALFH